MIRVWIWYTLSGGILARLGRLTPVTVVRLSVLIPLYAILQCTGCSVVGFTIGAVVDGNTPEKEVIAPPGWSAAESGTTVQMTTAGGESLTGEILAAGHLTRTEWSSAYSEWLSQSPGNAEWPGVHETLEVSTTLKDDRIFEGSLSFLDHDKLSIASPHAAVQTLPLSVLVEIRWGGGSTLSGDVIREKVVLNQVPLAEMITLAVDHDTVRIPYYRLSKIEELHSRNMKWNLGLVGLAVDVAVSVVGFLLLANMDWGEI